jgi:hypothetical protein
MVPLAVAGVDCLWAGIERSLGAHSLDGLVQHVTVILSSACLKLTLNESFVRGIAHTVF